MGQQIDFHPTPEDEHILRDAALPGETSPDTLRRALRLLDQAQGHSFWLRRFRAEAERLAGEDLTREPDAW